MVLKTRSKALITLFILTGILAFSHIMNYVSVEATKTLIEAGQDRSFQMVFYNFILYYVCGGLLSFATFHFIAIFKVKYLTRPLQITCIIAIAIQLMGAIGYIGLWNEAYFTQCLMIVTNHYNALIALTVVQLLLFVNFWMNNYVAHIDRLRAVSWSLYAGRMSSPERVKAK